MNPLWSWALTLLGVAGHYFVGTKRWQGYTLLIVNETLWIVYAVTTRQYGFILGAVLYMAAFGRSMNAWVKDEAADRGINHRN